jgi:probable rRNA maturation factor
LSFALDEDGGEPKLLDEKGVHLLGDVLISAQTAKKQADEFGHGLNREITYLAVHGFLHLLGYDHMTESDKKIMRTKEEEVLRAINLSEEFFTREK